MSGNTEWSLGGKPPGPAHFPAQTYDEQHPKAKQAEEQPVSVRATDEGGNVRPADDRFLDEPEQKPKSPTKSVRK